MSTLSQLFRISNINNILAGWGILKVVANNQATLSLDASVVTDLIDAALSTPAELNISGILTALKTIDGIGSGLDADLLDGREGDYYLDFNNLTNKGSTLLGYGITSSQGLLLQANPINALDAATKQYVDNLSLTNATTSTIGGVKLSTAPASSQNPIAIGDNDSRITAIASKAPLESPTFTGTVAGITKSMIGLTNVTDTNDANKPISIATQTALDLKANLDGPTFTGTVFGITKAMIGLTSVTDTSDINKPISTATQTALALKANLISPDFTGTVTGITAAMIGLGNATNTSDANKPISTATQTALDLKQSLTAKGAINGYCPLNASTKIDTAYLPDSIVGSLNYQGTWNATSNSPAIPASSGGNKGYFYIVTVSGSTLIDGISSWSIGDWIVSTGAVWNKVSGSSAISSVNTRTGAIVLSSSDVGLSNVDNTSDVSKPISTATQTALNLKANLASPTFTGVVTGITKAMVGLTNAADTSDANKPISTATQTALNLRASIDSPTFTGTVFGITKAMVGLTNVTDTSDANKPVSIATQTALNLKANLSSPTFTGTVYGITATMIGLGNVTNTADSAKPVSTAQQTALDLKANLSNPTFAGTVYGITAAMVGLGSVNNTDDSAKPVSSPQQTALNLKANLTSPSFVTPALGTPASGNLAYCTFPTLNQNTAGTAQYANVAWATGTGNNFQMNSLGVGTAGSGTAGEIRAVNSITSFYSDERLKTNIVPIANALLKLNSLNGVTFNSNEVAAFYGFTDTKEQVGVIAQEVEVVLPHIVVAAPFDIGRNPDNSEYSISGRNYKTVQYERLIPLLIEAIKELSIKVSDLEKYK